MTGFNQPLGGNEMPRFAGPASMMRPPVQETAQGPDACVLGVPTDIGASNRPGTRLRPRQIRDESRMLRPDNMATGAAPFEHLQVADIGDVPINTFDLKKSVAIIENHLSGVLAPVADAADGGDARPHQRRAGRSELRHRQPRSRLCPGTGTVEPGGLTIWQAIGIVRGCAGLNLVGCDLVEVSPLYDAYGNTAMVAASLLYEMLCVLPGVPQGRTAGENDKPAGVTDDGRPGPLTPPMPDTHALPDHPPERMRQNDNTSRPIAIFYVLLTSAAISRG